MDVLPFEAGAFYILDKAYIDFKRLFGIHQSKAFFVTRAKENLVFNRLYSAIVDKAKGIVCDQTITLKGNKSQKQYPEKLRRIKFYDQEQGKTFVTIQANSSIF